MKQLAASEEADFPGRGGGRESGIEGRKETEREM